ncbi:hypothetical protein CHLNCDRAFT_141630 [Chlorella variabilis]|uniref:peptidyl-tRNA hydrolase n=1 Tax=Chlorella variabilis TaxID=554065 RepID=E1ZT74_CHLVA|nr:hypothetical protein CHLNCDRAFT_141630 [Chlorella variabilis]EFN50980.1 hypothetical protein CHLNCDRAFT_141630 [Chlorella variabilis]|eukprot:XP_005843082.1 hypothetical protein CHLNCDRAFT_141630 [Chlorella variabilis]
MGQALSLLPPPLGRRGAAAAAAAKTKAGKASIDRPGEEDPDLWMVCGLGNPGPRYESTRHNVGFMAVDQLARQEGIAVNRLQETAVVGRGRFAGKKVLLVKPMTFMNVSGEAVGRLARFYRVPAERVLDFTKVEREEVDVAVHESIDIIRSVLTVGLEKAASGMRVDAAGKPILPPHSNGKQGGGQGGGRGSGQPAAKKQRQFGGGGEGGPAAAQQRRQPEAAAAEPTRGTAAATAAP